MVLHLATVTASCRVSTLARNFLPGTLISGSQLPRRLVLSSHRAISLPASTMAVLPFKPGATFSSQSGKTYTILEVLAERLNPLLCVYRARADGHDFIVKNLIPDDYDYQQDLQKSVASCPNLRTVVDGLPGPDLFIYPYLKSDLLQFSQRKLPESTRRCMLKSALNGLAALHERNIIHSDIKPNNILVDFDEQTDGTFFIKKVQISDMEDAVKLAPGSYLRGCLCGNQMWRSPESWARATQGISSDIFSFGIVCIYVMLNKMVLRASDEELAASDSWQYILRRQISLFGEEEGFKGLLKWIGEKNPFFERLITLAASFDDSINIRQPFDQWLWVDAEFRDLVCRMTNLDPERRITAREALEHPWFAQRD